MIRTIAPPCIGFFLAVYFAGIAVSLQAADLLPELLRERLLLMDEVAVYKWRHDLAVEDLAREKVVIGESTADALGHGLVPATSRQLFVAQMNAAKEIQHYWFSRWQNGEAVPARRADLDGEIRPQLSRLGATIVAAAARRQHWEREDLERALSVEGLSTQGRDAIIAAIRNLEVYSDRLAQILDTGILRVATTGDYPPFTFRANEKETFSGVDIELARDLAAALGVEAVFIHTSWPTLMGDLKAGRYDIAMGGVSRTLERQRSGFFSIPYLADGKTVIARCKGDERFVSLEDIDRPGVRVIVNPGGTNEKYVDANIRRAEKILHLDNRTIFERVANGDADLMITDRIEAQWQAAKRPGLCLPMAENLTYHEKGYLMPKDVALKEFVDAWLSLRLAEGRIAAALGGSLIDETSSHW